MAKPKGWRKSNKCFLQPPTNGCLAAVSWEAGVEYYGMKKGNDKWEAHVACELSLNRDALSHWVSRKADLKPLRAMRRELDAFEEACSQAITEVEQYNAKS